MNRRMILKAVPSMAALPLIPSSVLLAQTPSLSSVNPSVLSALNQSAREFGSAGNKRDITQSDWRSVATSSNAYLMELARIGWNDATSKQVAANPNSFLNYSKPSSTFAQNVAARARAVGVYPKPGSVTAFLSTDYADRAMWLPRIKTSGVYSLESAFLTAIRGRAGLDPRGAMTNNAPGWTPDDCRTIAVLGAFAGLTGNEIACFMCLIIHIFQCEN